MTLALAVLAASLLGSVHCAGMCGAFVCFYAAPGGTPSVRPRAVAWSHATYNGGRLVSYLALGFGAGALGGAVDRAGALAGIGNVAAIIAGGLMIAWGVHTALLATGHRAPAVPVPAFATRWMSAALAQVRDQPPAMRALVTGLVTTLLPCGWLYTFVATAGGTGSALRGAALMGTFWVGTLPMMLAVGAGAQRVFGRHAARLPLMTAMAVSVLGVVSVVGHVAGGRGVHSAHLPVSVAHGQAPR